MPKSTRLIGPFSQIVTLQDLPLKGPLKNSQLRVIPDAGIIVKEDRILEIGLYNQLLQNWKESHSEIEEINEPMVLVPGFVDPHTHICWAGSRSGDYSQRLEGNSYESIAKSGGGIWNTVTHTRSVSFEELVDITRARAKTLLHRGVTTIEVKSGYGLNAESELKMLEVIKEVNSQIASDLIPTCLAAHILPKDYEGDAEAYLRSIVADLLPQIKKKDLANRIDIYIDANAFTPDQALSFLNQVSGLGFDCVVHADQFNIGGSKIAVLTEAISADHLEASTDMEIFELAKSGVIPVALPGASIGLGDPFAPARKLLDAGASLAIGSDWNPGSAPMGDLLLQAAILGVYEKLSIAETLAGITFRSAAALNLHDRGVLQEGKKADFIGFALTNFEDIFYNQGAIKPVKVWKDGDLVNTNSAC